MAKCISTVKEWCAKNDVDYIWYDTAPGTIEARFGMKDVPHLYDGLGNKTAAYI